MADKFTKNQYSANLFDTSQDIIGALPLKLVEQWLGSEQTYKAALQLLNAYKVKGYSVCSDSAGLTKLTKQKGLLEILAIINQPKEIVHGFGTAIGGEGVGIWAADNTQMFYPKSVNSASLLSALLTMQDEINKSCQIKIGIGAHYGEFYSISGGLYGLEADAIEEIAENETKGGEIVISQTIYELLPQAHNFTIVKKSEEPTVIGEMFQVLDGPRLSDVTLLNKKYPIPYSENFYADLINYQNRMNDSDFFQSLADKYLESKVVVLIERAIQSAENVEISLFENLSYSAIMKDAGLQLIPQSKGVEIKVVGSLGIYIFDDGGAALSFAQAFRQQLAKESISCRIGIDVGAVLVFDLAVGGKDIAGVPVNIASKMSQDRGEFGKLYLSSAMKELVDLSGFTEINYTVSGVEITAYQG